MIEVERKFLIPKLPAEVRRASAVRLRQGYLAIKPVEVRVRASSDGPPELTVKGTGGLVRPEITVPVDAVSFDALWELTLARLEKTRYRVPLRDVVLEVDVYDGSLFGLVVGEVEFVDSDHAAGFEPPWWFGREVTNDPAFRNASLAACSRKPVTE